MYNIKKIFITIFSIVIVLYFGVGLFLYSFQFKLLYHPTPNIKIDYPNIILDQDGTDIMVHILHRGRKNAIIYFGGNGESMAKSANYIAQQFPDFTCYLMDYRGYGGSKGKPREKDIYKDALALYDYIAKRHNEINIGGRSLGSGIATYVAARREVNRLALITPYDSILAIAQERYSIYPANLLLKDRYNSISNVKNIEAKTFIVIAENDKVIPLEHTKRLIDAFKKSKPMVTVIRNRGHNDISSDKRYYRVMQDFIRGTIDRI